VDFESLRSRTGGLIPCRIAKTAEHARLAEATGRAEDDLFNANPWYEWGPYLSERAWGTVREDYSEGGDAWDSFPHDHARSRAYRWNEDGMAGISDIRHELCLGLTLWNGNDAILKERMFGLTGPQGNHGEDVKEYWWYLEGLPSHALLRWRYHYPQGAFPYDALVNHGRGLHDPELELLDTGVFDDDRYWSVDVTYAKASPTEVLMRIELENHGPDEATLHVLPTLWFRNTWSWGGDGARPRIEGDGTALTVADHRLAGYRLEAAPGLDGAAPEALFCENETNAPRLFGSEATTPYPKDGINDHVVSGAATVNPGGFGTKAALRYGVTVAGGGKAELRLRLRGPATASVPDADWAGDAFAKVVAAREQDADEFYGALAPDGMPPEQMPVLRQASAGLVWSKQMYPYNVGRWLDGDPGEPPPPEAHRHGRNSGRRHLDSFDVLAMPDPWEYPWFAAWDLGFHCVPWAYLDPAFAKYQLVVLQREWFQHPNGALPAYEWNFDDVNPPVHVMAALRVFVIDGGTDREFLERVFQKLLINFTWWLNREDADGNNVFGGGFLGLDNISPIDRSNLPEGVSLQQADGTAWMAFYALSMLLIALERAEENEVYWDMVIKFLEQFVLVARALERQGLYDADDAFFYDRLVYPSGDTTQVKVKTISGLLPVLPAVPLSARVVKAAERLGKRFARLRAAWAQTGGTLGVGRLREGGSDQALLVSVIDPDDLRKTLAAFFDEAAFLSPHGLRAVSKRYEGNPYALAGVPGAWIDYEPAESTTSMFGGNSNWRGPIWMPLNYLAIRQFVIYQQFFGDDFKLEYPTGSGPERTFGEIAQDLSDRIVSIWLPGPDGRRPLYGGTERLQTDPAWKDNLLFNEYFHGDNGAGLGAAHQTGWTALVADLILDPPSAGRTFASSEVVPPDST
jgi:Mannosylglycerate hydrolase MGH1-like glycoside hydrolase domain